MSVNFWTDRPLLRGRPLSLFWTVHFGPDSAVTLPNFSDNFTSSLNSYHFSQNVCVTWQPPPNSELDQTLYPCVQWMVLQCFYNFSRLFIIRYETLDAEIDKKHSLVSNLWLYRKYFLKSDFLNFLRMLLWARTWSYRINVLTKNVFRTQPN